MVLANRTHIPMNFTINLILSCISPEVREIMYLLIDYFTRNNVTFNRLLHALGHKGVDLGFHPNNIIAIAYILYML